MDRNEKERQVAELTERLRTSETLIVADYRGLTMPQIDALRTRLLEQGARFTVVKNTLTRRAAEAVGAEALLALLEGPTAIAFLESDGDPAAVAKALQEAARETQVLAIRGGILQGRAVSSEEVAELATLPSLDVLRGQVLGAITAPLTNVVGLFTAPLRDLVGLIDARIAQLEEPGDSSGAEASAVVEEAPADEAPADEAPAEAAEDTPVASAETETETNETPEEDATAAASDTEKEEQD